MCERLVENASKQSDPLFNLISLKMKYLISNATCESCKQPVQEWSINKVCHHTVCEKCLEHVENKRACFCPVCNTKFDLRQDITLSKNMKESFSQIQELIYSLLSIEKGTSDLLFEDESQLRATNKSSMIHIESVKLKRAMKDQNEVNDKEPMKRKRTDEPNCSNFNENSTQIESNMKITEHEQHLETTTLNELQFNNDAFSDFTDNSQDNNKYSKPQSSNNNNKAFNLENNMAERTPTSTLQIEKNTKATEHKQDSEITLSDEIQLKNVAINSIKINSQNCDMSDKKSFDNNSSASNSENNLFQKTPNSILLGENDMEVTEHEQCLETNTLDELKLNNDVSIEDSFQEQHKSDSDCSDSDSANNMIYGTPPNSSLVVSNPTNVYNRKDICISYSNFNDKELNAIEIFYQMFKVRASVDWSDGVTHLIVKLDKNGNYARTRKCINALLSNCFIVSEEWILRSISRKNIQPEQEYIPLDQSGEAAPLQSWRIGQGLVDSSMLWTKRWVLYFHSSVKSHDYFADLKGWAFKVGFIVIDQMKDFNGVVSDLRIVLTDFRNPEKDIEAASNSELLAWLSEYKAITIHLDWYLEVLCRYRCVLIEPQYQVLKLSVSMMETAGIIHKNVISTLH